MPIQLPQGLQINAKQAVDTRLLLSYEKMRTQDDNVMPVKYFTICVEDGGLYLYDKNNEVDETTGKFRPILGRVNLDIEDLKRQVQELNNELSNKLGKDNLLAGDNVTIEEDSEGNLIISSTGGGMDPERLAIELPGALRKALERQADKDAGLIVDSEGNIKVSVNSEHLKIEDNKIDLQEGILLQAIENNLIGE